MVAPVDERQSMRLPVELLVRVCDEACFIDPSLSRTLCLVSSLLKAISAPLVYRAIFVHGNQHLQAVVTHLQNHPDKVRLVQHLAFTDHCQPSRRDTMDHPGRRAGRNPNISLHASSRRKDRQNYGDAGNFETLVSLVAPTLLSLHVAFYSGYHDQSRAFRAIIDEGRRWPRLEEFAYRGNDSKHVSDFDLEPPAFIPVGTFPALRRLHIFLSETYSEYGVIDSIRAACPGLRHLRICEPEVNLTRELVEQFMHRHCVQIDHDEGRRTKIVSMLKNNALLGFPLLETLVVDCGPDMLDDRRLVLRNIAARRKDVVVFDTAHRTKQRAPKLSFIREVWEKSLGGDRELWEPTNELFDPVVSEAWKPMRGPKPRRGWPQQGVTFSTRATLRSTSSRRPQGAHHSMESGSDGGRLAL